MVLFAFFAVLL